MAGVSDKNPSRRKNTKLIWKVVFKKEVNVLLCRFAVFKNNDLIESLVFEKRF